MRADCAQQLPSDIVFCPAAITKADCDATRTALNTLLPSSPNKRKKGSGHLSGAPPLACAPH